MNLETCQYPAHPARSRVTRHVSNGGNAHESNFQGIGELGDERTLAEEVEETLAHCVG